MNKLTGLLASAAAAAVIGAAVATGSHYLPRRSRLHKDPNEALAWRFSAARHRLGQGTALVAASVLADSAMEHYRGGFRNPAMFLALGVAAAALREGCADASALSPRISTAAKAVYGVAVAVGMLGFGFHCFNIAKRPGGWSWENLFYAAPVGAPMALSLAGLLGLSGQALSAGDSWLGSERTIAAVSALGLAGAALEAGLLHFRGAYQNPAMFLPVLMPPVAAAGLSMIAIRPRLRVVRWTRLWLKLTAALGLAGMGFHAHGISRSMGGWKNWSQNLLGGPPLPAPPSFTGLALSGLAALSLHEERRRP